MKDFERREHRRVEHKVGGGFTKFSRYTYKGREYEVKEVFNKFGWLLNASDYPVK